MKIKITYSSPLVCRRGVDSQHNDEITHFDLPQVEHTGGELNTQFQFDETAVRGKGVTMILSNVEKSGYTIPTRSQAHTIPTRERVRAEALVLIVAPTRKLCWQESDWNWLFNINIHRQCPGRGLDIRNVMHVVNFDLPQVEYNGQDEYIHRIGRTARIGNTGLATSFYSADDEPMATFLAKILVESGNEVPDFLDEFKPEEGAPLDFDDDSGDEENEPVQVKGTGEVDDAQYK